jgi:hypothetical protein
MAKRSQAQGKQQRQRLRRGAQAASAAQSLPDPDPTQPPQSADDPDVRFVMTEGAGDINAHMTKYEDAGYQLVSMNIDPHRGGPGTTAARWWVFCWRTPSQHGA